jgi:hypothetical protein
MVDYLKDNPDYKKSGERLVKIIRVAIILIIWCDYFYQTRPKVLLSGFSHLPLVNLF